ncbi:OsmC family peroxiredoxin [Pseudohoeflea suaedae]|uniref:OsmC family peroxiredoxin n=1 Tax=Pseudohoeflea suaedae TaxID=877384 RepID=A0A4V3A721_9HYPH|nr:OsmC family protein [Pseudohoeflea suaedae]TDH35952.1 OsmC family peroxiredoxin [Pseudohoeflea suaedae]
MAKPHDFTARIRWTGNTGEGTSTYRSYDRTWNIETEGKEIVACSNDPMLGGDPSKHNPEDLLIASLASCHMLWYLHLASVAKIVVRNYVDDPVGHGESEPDGTGRFLSATLRPRIEVPKGTDLEKAEALHHEVHKYCFIARSVNFPVTYEPAFIEV